MNAVLDIDIAEQQRRDRKHENKYYSRAAGFARRKFSVNGKLSAAVTRKFVFEQFCEQKRCSERKYHADIIYKRVIDAVYQIEHIQPPKFSFTAYYTIHLRI